MKQAFVNWLADILAPWFIPREDYDAVQERQSRAIWQAKEADRIADRAVRETHELLTKSYEGYRPFEHYADRAEVREFRHKDVSLPGETWGWSIRLDDMRFYTMCDPKREFVRIKEHAADQLTQKFRQHIREKLFALSTQ